MIDSHAHLYSDAFKEDLEQVIENARQAGMEKIILANVDRDSVPKLLQICKQHPDLCVPTIGLHPAYVKEDYETELTELKKILDSRDDFKAIGEFGVDLYRAQDYVKEQKVAFITQLKWAQEKDLPVILHIRDAFDLFYEIMEEVKDIKVRGVVHCFSGTVEDVVKINALGDFYFSISGIVTFKNSQMDDVIRAIGIDKILIETDAPYLSPEPKRSKRNEPAFVAYTADKISDILEMETTIIKEKTANNAKKLFNLD